MELEAKETRLNIRIGNSFKTRLQDAAKAESRTLASFVINALKQYLEQHHPQPAPQKEESPE